MDFNTQRKIVRKLKETGKNPLLFLPCLIAAAAVTAFMSAVRAVDMALSDKDGNFLGIKRREKRAKPRAQVPNSGTLLDSRKPVRRPKLIYRPLWQRTVSLILACAFMTMNTGFAAAAESVVLIPLVISKGAELITADNVGVDNYRNYSELDLSTGYQSPDTAVRIGSNVFSNMPYLSTITLGYSTGIEIGNGNFTNIAPDATIFVDADTEEMYNEVLGKIPSNSTANVIWDRNGEASALIPADVSVLNAYSGVGNVILKWKSVSQADGYSIYKYESGKYKFVSSITAELDEPNTMCAAYDKGTAGKSQVYAVRAYRVIDSGMARSTGSAVYSKHFAKSESASPLVAAKPELTVTMSNKTASVNVSLPQKGSAPSYIVIYCQDEGELYFSPRHKFVPEQMTNGVYTFTDTKLYNGEGVRSYIAVSYYDTFNEMGSQSVSQYTYPEKDENTPEFTTTRSAIKKITESVLNSPTGLDVKLSSDKKVWTLTWNRPEGTSEFDVYYSVYVNGRPVISEVNRYTSDYAKINVNDPNIVMGGDVEFTVTAHADGLTSGEPVSAVIEIDALNSVILNSLRGGNTIAEVNFTEHKNTNVYTIYLTYTDSTGTERTDIRRVSEGDKGFVKKNGNITYTVTGLTNDVEYEVYVSSDAPTALYSSGVKTVTPSRAPQPPAHVEVKALENSAVISWDIVTREDTGEPVDGYLVSIVKETGLAVVTDEKVEGVCEYTPKVKLENDVNYRAIVKSYIIVDDNMPIESVSATRSELFTPTVIVDDVMGLAVTPEGKTIKVTWSAVKGASEYILTRSSASEPVREIFRGTATSFVDQNVDNKTEYSYRVMAVRKVDGKDYAGEYSSEQKGMINISLTSVQGLVITGADGTITLKWDKVNGAEGYYVQYSECDKNNWTTIANVGKTEFTHTGLKNRASYDYRIIPYTIVNGKEISSSEFAQKVTGTAGTLLPAPADFTVTAGDGQITLSWSAVDGADGYNVYLVAFDGQKYLLDSVSKTTAIHANLSNGTSFEYCVSAFKNVNGAADEGDFSVIKGATVGVELNAPTDVAAKSGKGEVTLTWKAVQGAEGYVVYCYNMNQMSFTPVGIVTSTNFKHTGLTSGRDYTYMVAAYKNIGGNAVYSGYSLAVTAKPEAADGTKPTDTSNEEAGDYRIYITGTTPYGMTNSNLISAFAGKGAFNSDIDVRFTLSPDTVSQVQNVLNFYGEGIESFLIYPMDIALYAAGTDTRAAVNEGYYLTLTIPVPDELLPYSEHISVVHVSDLEQLEILPSIHVDVNGVDCVQFTANSFSPYAFVVYLPEIGEDTSAGSASAAQGTAQSGQNVQSAVYFRNTYLPVLYRRRMRNRVFRVVK